MNFTTVQPASREGSSLIGPGPNFYLFGGKGCNLYNKIFRYDCINSLWYENTSNSSLSTAYLDKINEPEPRYFHSAVYYKQKI